MTFFFATEKANESVKSSLETARGDVPMATLFGKIQQPSSHSPPLTQRVATECYATIVKCRSQLQKKFNARVTFVQTSDTAQWMLRCTVLYLAT